MIVMKETSDPNSFPLVWDVKNEEKARIANAGSGKLEKLKRRGLAELSYHVANQICMEKYGQPIHSGALNEQSVGIWKKLIEQKLAVQERELASDYMSGRANTLGVFRFK